LEAEIYSLIITVVVAMIMMKLQRDKNQ